MAFKVRTSKLKTETIITRCVDRSLKAAGRDVEEVIRECRSMDSSYSVVADKLHYVREKIYTSSRVSSDMGVALQKITELYEKTEKNILSAEERSGRGTDSGSRGSRGQNNKTKDDYVDWFMDQLRRGPQIDNFKGVPDWMEYIGWLNRMSPWSWIWYRATREGWLDELFDAADFERAEDGTFHVNTNKYEPNKINQIIRDKNGVCWQEYGGYRDAYDAIFDTFCDMDANRDLTFKTESGTTYTLWRWKGDYLNLGAGGEIGLYKGDGDDVDCAVEDELKISMHVDYGDGTSTDWSDETWWCTSFNPEKQGYRAEDLTITYTVDFSDADPEMWEAFRRYQRSNPDVKIIPGEKKAIIRF